MSNARELDIVKPSIVSLLLALVIKTLHFQGLWWFVSHLYILLFNIRVSRDEEKDTLILYNIGGFPPFLDVAYFLSVVLLYFTVGALNMGYIASWSTGLMLLAGKKVYAEYH